MGDKKRFFGMFNGQRGAERGSTNYRPRDDGSHIYTRGDYYEWWYFDASFDNDYHVAVAFHYRNVFMGSMIPTIQLMIYKPDGTKVARYAACSENETYACPDYCDVVMEDSWAKDTSDGLEIYMKIKDVGVHLTFKNVVPGWTPGTGFLYHDSKKEQIGGWVIPVPRGDVEGELFIKDETIPVKGSGYHDHNWGNYRSSDTTKGWYWGRIHSKKYTIVYSWIVPSNQGDPVTSPLLIVKPGEIVLSTDMMHTELGDFVKDEKNGREYAKELTITSDVMGVKLDLTINTNQVVELIELPKVTDWDQFYYRFLADYKMNIEIDGVAEQATGNLLHEYMDMGLGLL